jgi:uncharacterized protein YndB with AHSA1/START domain
MNTQILSFTQAVKAPPDVVYRAFTNATALREWLCDAASVLPHPGGRLYLAWNSGYYTSGEYTVTQPGEKIAFTWRGRGEPSQTEVQVSLAASDGRTLVTLEHLGLGMDDEWRKTFEEVEVGWKTGLENLASVLETGEDMRFTRRPMLGITVGDYDDERAKALGVPVAQGIRLDGTLEGMGAYAAGLQGNDVIVGMAGHPVTDYPSLTNALQKHRSGDEIEVEFFRGGEKKTVSMRLSQRPVPEIPGTAAELAKAVRPRYAEMEAELDKLLQGVSDEEASYRPAEGEWTLKENLAHLLQGERGLHFFIADLITGEERVSDGFGDNVQAQVEATVAAYPTLADLREELRHNSKETVEFLARLPESFVAEKRSYWRVAYYVLDAPYHLRGHIEQMQAAIGAARAAEKAAVA